MARTAEPTGSRRSKRRATRSPRRKRILLEALRGRGGKLTKADAMTVSGLPEAETQQALTVLLKEYRSHLSATESGELVYEFDPAFERRGALTWRERLAAVGAALWTGFTFLFKISIVVTLVVYFVLFVAMLIALIFARRGDDRTTTAASVSASPICSGSGAGTRASAARPRGGDSPAKPAKPFYKSVFDFVFGPPRAARSIRWPTRRRSWRRSASATDASAPSIWSSSWAGTSIAPRKRRRGCSPTTAASPR